MASTAKKMRKMADEVQSNAESKFDDARSTLRDAADEVAYQMEGTKRNPFAVTLIVLLTLGVVGAILMLLKESNE
jgi:hypothetical protein